MTLSGYSVAEVLWTSRYDRIIILKPEPAEHPAELVPAGVALAFLLAFDEKEKPVRGLVEQLAVAALAASSWQLVSRGSAADRSSGPASYAQTAPGDTHRSRARSRPQVRNLGYRIIQIHGLATCKLLAGSSTARRGRGFE